MGHDNVPSLSPVKWRATNPQSPSVNPFKRSGIHIRDESPDKADLGWRALVKRHQFLLLMLTLLTFLCTIYLYFAITFTSVDRCSSLNGNSKLLCYQTEGRAAHDPGTRRRTLRQYPREVSGHYVLQQLESIPECSKQYEDFAPCKNSRVLSGVCRLPEERPPLCKIPVPEGYRRPQAWRVIPEVESSVPKLIRQSDALNDQEQADELITRNPFGSDFAVPFVKPKRLALRLVCEKFQKWPSGLRLDNFSSLSILADNKSGSAVQKILDEGMPALLITILDGERFPAESFHMIRSDCCGDQCVAQEFVSGLSRLLREGGEFSGTCSWKYSLDVSEEFERQKLRLVGRWGNSCVWRKDVPGVRLESDHHEKSRLLHKQIMRRVGASSKTKLRSQSESLYALSDYSWRSRIAHYIALLGQHEVRLVNNVLDMNAGIGSFAMAFMRSQPAWVMNVVPASAPERLKTITDRGLFAVSHNWSEAFPTPPRSFDLVHSSWTLTEFQLKRVDLIDLMLEVDRVLRPGGFAIIQDTAATVFSAKLLGRSLQWQLLHEYSEEGSATERILILRKE